MEFLQLNEYIFKPFSCYFSLSVENGELSQRLGCAISERDSYLGQVKELQSKGAEEIYMAQIKEV